MKQNDSEEFDDEIKSLKKEIEKSHKEITETFVEIDKTKASLEKKAYDGTRDTLKYFDGIHDKLFTFNNIMIAGGFFSNRKIERKRSDGV